MNRTSKTRKRFCLFTQHLAPFLYNIYPVFSSRLFIVEHSVHKKIIQVYFCPLSTAVFRQQSLTHRQFSPRFLLMNDDNILSRVQYHVSRTTVVAHVFVVNMGVEDKSLKMSTKFSQNVAALDFLSSRKEREEFLRLLKRLQDFENKSRFVNKY